MKHFIFSFFISLSFLSGFVSCLNGGANRLPPIFSYIDWRGGSTSVPFGVSQITPGVDVNGVSTNTSIQVGFNRNLDSSSISNVSFQLSDGSTQIPGSVSSVNSNLIFTPSSQLTSSTMYTVILSKNLKSTDGTSLGADFIWNFTTLSVVDLIPPIVSLTAPVLSSVSVPVNTSVSVAFSEMMNCASLNSTSFTLSNGAPVLGSVACSGSTATFTPTSDLLFNTSYTVTVTTAARDLAGNSIVSPFIWNFTTGSAPDSTPPLVSFVSPGNTSIGFAVNGSVAVAFSESIDCSTVTTASFLLSDGSPIGGTVSCLGTTAFFNPNSSLAYGTTYTATINTGVRDISSNALTAPFSWTFTTGTGPDLTPPMISLVTPSNSLSGVGANTSVSAVFSEFVDCTTLTTASFTLEGPSTVPGTVNCLGTSATFTPSSILSYNTGYAATVTTAVRDLAGNSIASTFLWSFTTGSAPDSTPPLVSVTNPLNASSGFSVNGILNIAFSETLNCASVTSASFTLSDGSPVPGTVGCSSTSATFTPIGPLSYNTTYTATITTGVKDLAGNSLASPFVWTFTTGSTPDVTAPTVSIVNPIQSSVGVATSATVMVAFSEGMDCNSLTTATFTLNNGSAVPGTVSCSGTSAVFTPSSILLSGTLYTATIQIGAKDLANNSIASVYTWSFTTGALPDTIPPGVSIQNLKNKSLVESGFVIGSASDAGGVALVEVSIDGGAYASASGTTAWNFKLPSGAATWSVGSQHTIAVRSKDSSGNLSTISSVQVRKGTNKDVNGDGYVDMVTGEYGQGIVYIFHSSGTSGITATNASLANRYIVGLASDEFGKSVVLGDVNGDGYSDVIAGAPAANTNTGRVYAFYSSGSSGVNISFVSFASARIDGAVASERFGFVLETGDLDGNGFTDLIVGAPYSSTNTGKVYTFHSSGTSGILDSSATTAAAVLTGSATNEFFGSSLAQGNINGDIYSDLVVGAYGYSAQKGRVSIYHGSSTGLGTVSSTLTNTAGSGQFGFSVAVADVSGDGFGDLIAGAPFLNSAKGQVVVYVSSSTSAGILTSSGLSAANFIILGTVISDHLGNSVAARDLDLDGKADLILNSTPNAPAQGIVYVYMSPILSYTDTTTASLTMTGPMGDLYGWGLATGDVNGDGYGDLYVGSPGYNNGNFLGRTFIFHSSGSGLNTSLPSSASKILDGSGLTGGSGNWFGRSLY